MNRRLRTVMVPVVLVVGVVSFVYILSFLKGPTLGKGAAIELDLIPQEEWGAYGPFWKNAELRLTNIGWVDIKNISITYTDHSVPNYPKERTVVVGDLRVGETKSVFLENIIHWVGGPKLYPDLSYVITCDRGPRGVTNWKTKTVYFPVDENH